MYLSEWVFLFLFLFLLWMCTQEWSCWIIRNSIFSFVRTLHTLFHSGCPSLHSCSQCWWFLFLRMLANICYLCSFWWQPFWMASLGFVKKPGPHHYTIYIYGAMLKYSHIRRHSRDLGKTRLLYSQVLEVGDTHAHTATWKGTRMRRQKTTVRGMFRPWPFGHFLGKAKDGRVKNSGLAHWKSWWDLCYGSGSLLAGPCPWGD